MCVLCSPLSLSTLLSPQRGVNIYRALSHTDSTTKLQLPLEESIAMDEDSSSLIHRDSITKLQSPFEESVATDEDTSSLIHRDSTRKLQPHFEESVAIDEDTSSLIHRDSTTELVEGSVARDGDTSSFPPIPVSTFPAHLDRKHANGNYGFLKEYCVSSILFHHCSHLISFQ